MTDDNIIDLDRARRSTVTHEVPSENPDRFKADNLRDLAPEGETLAYLGLDANLWPIHTEGSTRIGLRTLKELRDRADSAALSAAEAEQSLTRAAALHHLAKAEMKTLGKRLTEIIGDGDEPEDFDPRGGAA